MTVLVAGAAGVVTVGALSDEGRPGAAPTIARADGASPASTTSTPPPAPPAAPTTTATSPSSESPTSVPPLTTSLPVTVPPTTVPPTTVPVTVPPTTVSTEPLPHEQAIGNEALALISYPWRTALPGWRIDFLPGKAGYLGGTLTNEQRIEIYVREGQSPHEIAFTLAHELGHAVDLTYLTDAERQTWKVTRGISTSTPWWAGSGVSDYASGSGDWAEAFAVWQVGGTSETRIAGQPTAGELQVLAALAAG